MKDILFYNFFDLNRFRTHGHLDLGSRDILARYESKARQAYVSRNAQQLGDQILEDMQFYASDANETDIDRIVDDAMKLINLASKIKEDGALEDILKNEIGKKFYDEILAHSDNP